MEDYQPGYYYLSFGGGVVAPWKDEIPRKGLITIQRNTHTLRNTETLTPRKTFH
jgi:hypothetical protein